MLKITLDKNCRLKLLKPVTDLLYAMHVDIDRNLFSIIETKYSWEKWEIFCYLKFPNTYAAEDII